MASTGIDLFEGLPEPERAVTDRDLGRDDEPAVASSRSGAHASSERSPGHRPGSAAASARRKKEIARRAREDEDVRRPQTIPGAGPITATALVALAPNAAAFGKGARLR